MRHAMPSAAAAVVVTIAVPPVMTTAGAPTLARNKCAGTCSNQSTNGRATAAAGYCTDESTAERSATYLRRGRLRQNQENNRRYKSDRWSVNHFSYFPRTQKANRRPRVADGLSWSPPYVLVAQFVAVPAAPSLGGRPNVCATRMKR
jgi:hypothetical protein